MFRAHVKMLRTQSFRKAGMHNICAQNAINLELAAHFILMCHKLFKQKSAPSSSDQLGPTLYMCVIF